MSITGSNNPFACNPVVFANANSIVSLGTITRDGNQFTFSVGFVWKINGVTYQNTAPVVITITEASEGFNRIDNALLNTSNTIELQQGLESDTIALRPVAPETNIVLTSWNISGTTIGDAEASILGTQFKKKSESAAYNDPALSGSDAVIKFQPNGESVYAFSNAGLVSIDGFGLDLITGNPSAEVPYPGKDIFIYNNKAGNLTLKHDGSGTADVKFLLEGGVDLVIPAGGKVWLKYGPSYCEMIFKSWSEASDVLEFANLAAFPTTGESGKIYVALDTNKTYRWSGSAYVQLSSGIDFPVDGKTYGVKNGLPTEVVDNLYRSFFQYSARNDAGGIVALNAPIALVTSGTQSVVGISGTSKYSSIPLQNYLSATPNGSNCGWKQGTLLDGVIRQGFDVYMIWANNDANSNCMTTVGSYSLTAAIPNLDIANFTGDFFGVGNDVGDTNLSFYSHRVSFGGQTASYTKVATNSSFPAHTTTDAYLLRMEAPCTEVESDRYIKMTLTNIITGAIISHTFPYTQTPVLNRNFLSVINRSNRNTGVATNIRPSKIHYSRLIY